MSASLLINSAVLGTDGITLTIGVSGVSGSLAPTSGITGFLVAVTIDGHGRYVPISSATASGSTVTITLAESVNAEEDGFVTLVSTSNLTDTAGNTSTGQTNYVITSVSVWHAIGGDTFAAASRVRGGIIALPNGTYPRCAQFNSADGCVEFNADITQLNITVFCFSSHWVLEKLVSGVWTHVHDWGVSASSTVWEAQGSVTLSSGMAAYRILQVNTIGVPLQCSIIRNVQITGSLGTQPAVQPLVVEFGDSLVQLGGSDAPADSRNGHMFLSCDPLGMSNQHIGYAGYSVSGAGGLATSVGSALSNLGAIPALAYLRGGGNDFAASVSTTDLRTAWDSMIAAAQAVAAPPVKIVVLGLPTLASNDYAAYNAIIAASAAAHGCLFIDITKWVASSVDRQSDGLHFSSAGELLFANRFLPITAGQVLGASFTCAGPSSGVSGVASSVFTVTLAGGSTFTADSDSVGRQTITLYDGGAGGLFTPSIGSPGTGTVSVTPTSGSSFTFTYTPASTGAKTITCSTSIPGWVAPSALTYTASSGGGTTTYTLPISVSLSVSGTPFVSATITGSLVIVQ